MTRTLPLALVQAPACPAHDLSVFGSHLRQLARTYATTRLFVFPELHVCGADDGDWADGESFARAVAEPLNGPRDQALAQLAGELGIWLAPGSVYELGEDGRVHNTAVVYSPDGRRVSAYRKVFPWRPYETTAPGAEFVVFDMDGYGRVGLSVCYDSWFPESTRHLAWMGAELVLNVVRTPTVDRAQELVLARANAIVNQVFVASVNAAAPHGLGRSLLVDPEGRVRVEADSDSPVVLTDVVDLDEVTKVRTYGTAGLNRMWQQFGEDDAALELPLYNGRIEPGTWRPDPVAQPGDTTGGKS
jgi:predicted amidohydrolase